MPNKLNFVDILYYYIDTSVLQENINTTCKIHKNYIWDPRGFFSIVSHMSLSMISLISSLSLKLYLNSLVYHQNIFRSSLKVFGNLWKSSHIFGNFRKFSEKLCSGTFVWPSEQFWKIFGNLRKVVEIFGKSSKSLSSACLYNKKNITRRLEEYEFYSHGKNNVLLTRCACS